MEKNFDFVSSSEHYTADACVAWCFDDRFYKLLKAFGKQEGWTHIDLVKLAGGAKELAGADRDFLLNQIRLSMQLHGTRRIVLMTHRDCGGYGGSKAFPDANAERAAHEAQLVAAQEFVKKTLNDSGIRVDAYFADFDGVYRVD